MAKTLLAVDDSVTMRKVLEITFSGEDFRVITAENAQSALSKLGENPGIFVVDTVLGGEDGYALAKELRKRSPAAPIIMLASRYAPYDQARGRDAGADDFADKPFDTQQLIDKIRKVVVAKEAGGGAAAPQAVGGTPQQGAGTPYRAPAPPVAPQPTPAPPVAAAPAAAPFGRSTQQSLGGEARDARAAQAAAPAASARSGTLVFGEQPSGASPAPAAPRPVTAPLTAPREAAPAAPAPALAATAASPVGAAVNGHLAGKLGALGLTPAQADAVLALSREVVERIVWEVVPQLAETIIKEEITRLTKE